MAEKYVSPFKGAASAVITPFKDGKIDYNAFERIIEFQIKGGIDALVVSGTTGESATLSEEEHRELIKFAVKQVGGRVPVIAGTGSNNTERAIRMSRCASNIGCDGVLLVTPYYNKASADGLYESYKKISENTDVPMILYNVPSRTGMEISLNVYGRLAEIEKITAVKEASGSVVGMAAFMALYGERFALYSGSDEIIVPTLSLGGDGVISVLSNVVPGEVSLMCREWRNGNIDNALRLQLYYMELIKALFCEVNPIPVKYMMYRMGLCSCEFRLPLTPPGSESILRIDTAAEKYGIYGALGENMCKHVENTDK